LEEQSKVNKVMLELADKYKVKVIATNDVHYVNEEDFEAHQVLIQLNTRSDEEEEKKLIYTGKEFLKTKEEMTELFSDIPEAILNTQEITDKIEEFTINHKLILPVFPIPDSYKSDNEYLRHLNT